MSWKFDQVPNAACITCRAVVEGEPILSVTHYEDDHSWAFMDGKPIDMAAALVVSMSEIVERHPGIEKLAALPPGWSASRAAVDQPWLNARDIWDEEQLN